MNRQVKDYWVIIVAAVVLWVCMSACSSSRSVLKSAHRAEDDHSASAATNTVTEDRTVKVITEQADTTMTIPGVKVQSESVGTTTVIETDEGTMTARYDPVKNIIRQSFIAKPKVVPVRVNRRTEIHNDVRQVVQQKVDSASHHTELQVSKDKKFKTSWVVFGIFGILALIGVGYVVWRYVKKRVLL